MPDKERIKSIISKVRGLGRSGVSYVRDKVSSLLDDARETAGKIVEAAHADVYPRKEYTFEEAYKDARSKGQRTFFWNGKYYNTDYEGEHGEQYRRDVESGKAAAWEKAYPNFTNPELRKEKQEELDTYGITNEQTKNKNWIDEKLHGIPARGYNVEDAIGAITGGYSNYTQYDSREEKLRALYKKYNIKEFDEHGHPIIPEKYQMAYYDDVLSDLWANGSSDGNGVVKELHRPELNMLLGYPDKTRSLMVSKYKTGALPYYYTFPSLESSTPFGGERIFGDGMTYKSGYRDEYGNIGDYGKIYEEVLNMPAEEMTRNNLDLRRGWVGALDTSKIDKIPEKYLRSLYPSKEEVVASLPVGNTLVNNGDADYYEYGNNTNKDRIGVYTEPINKFIKIFGNYSNNNNEEAANAMYLSPIFNNDFTDLGTYTVGIPADRGYISIYDKFDIDPFGSGNDKPIIQVGKPFEYYTRFYPEGKTPDIDSMYNDFEFNGGGKIRIKPSHRGRLTELKKRTGKTEAELYNDGNPDHRKMVVFARNSRKWDHADGGLMHRYDGETEDTQQMNIMNDDVQYYDPTGIMSQYVDIARKPGERWRDYRNWLKDLAYNTAYDVAGGIEGGYNDPSSLSGRKRDIRRFERWYDKAVAQKAAEDREMELWRKNADGAITPEEFGELSSPRLATIPKALFGDPGTLQGIANGSIASTGLILGGGALRGALQNPAAVGNALQYMQPSKWLEMGLKPVLGATPYYSGALTGAGALADLAWDSYGIYEGVKNAGKTGSVPGEVLNTMNFIPGAVGLAQGAGRAYRAVSNAAHGIGEFARNPFHINTSLSDISGLDGLAGVEERPLAELYANLDEAIRAYDIGERDRVATQIRDRLRRNSLHGLATGDAYLSSDRYLMDVVNDNAIVNPDVNLGLTPRDNGFVGRDALHEMASNELFRRIEDGRIDESGYSLDDIIALEGAIERMRNGGRYDAAVLDRYLSRADKAIRTELGKAIRSGLEIPEEVRRTRRYESVVDDLIAAGEIGPENPNVRRLVDEYARRIYSYDDVLSGEAYRRGAWDYASDRSSGYWYPDRGGTFIPDNPVRSIRDIATKEALENLFKDAGIGDIDPGVIFNPDHPDYLRASEALRKHGAYDLPADVDHMYWFNVRDANEDYIRLSDELARLEKNVSEGKTLTQSEEERLKELKETLLPDARAKVSQSRKDVLERTNNLISSAPRGTGIKEHNTSTDSYRLMLRGAERAPGGYGYGPNQASVLVHKNPDGTPIMYEGNSLQLNRAMFAPDGSLRFMDENDALAGLLTRGEVQEIRDAFARLTNLDAMNEIRTDPHKLDIANRILKLAYTLNKRDYDSIAQSISRINSRYGENIPMPELTIPVKFTGSDEDIRLVRDIAYDLLGPSGYAPILKRPMITVVKHKYGGQIGATMQQDNYDKIMSAINKVKAGRK